MMGYGQNGRSRKAVEVFGMMVGQKVLVVDRVCLSVALAAFADVWELSVGEWIHGYVSDGGGVRADVCSENSIIDMYVKCGEVENAKGVFDGMRERDVTTWTSMIVGFTLLGLVREALGLFDEMTRRRGSGRKRENGSRKGSLVVPNDVTFLGVLMACSHGGMVEEGKIYFKSMVEDYGLKPREPHFGCMVDLLCRSGLVNEAYDFILGMPGKANAVLWRTLLGACSLHGNAELGVNVRARLLALDPRYGGDDVVLSNVFASKGLWNEKITTRERVKRRRSSPGCSSVKVALTW
ncbi:hypothetical protein Droror1_Dr00012162 [Drosera rotundifolia]